MTSVPAVAQPSVGDKITAGSWAASVVALSDWITQTDTTGAPFVQVRQATAQAAFAASTWTSITHDAEDFDPWGMHSTSSNTDRIVIGGLLGVWKVWGMVAFASNGTGNTRRAQVTFNGSAIVGSQKIEPPSASFCSVITPAVFVRATSAADYVNLQGYHEASASVATSVSGSYASILCAEYKGQ